MRKEQIIKVNICKGLWTKLPVEAVMLLVDVAVEETDGEIIEIEGDANAVVGLDCLPSFLCLRGGVDVLENEGPIGAALAYDAVKGVGVEVGDMLYDERMRIDEVPHAQHKLLELPLTGGRVLHVNISVGIIRQPFANDFSDETESPRRLDAEAAGFAYALYVLFEGFQKS